LVRARQGQARSGRAKKSAVFPKAPAARLKAAAKAFGRLCRLIFFAA
jgi:hypothetical protein